MARAYAHWRIQVFISRGQGVVVIVRRVQKGVVATSLALLSITCSAQSAQMYKDACTAIPPQGGSERVKGSPVFNRIEAGCQQWAQAVKDQPTEHGVALLILGTLYDNAKDPKNAERVYLELAGPINGSAPAAGNQFQRARAAARLGQIYLDDRRYADAQAWFNQALDGWAKEPKFDEAESCGLNVEYQLAQGGLIKAYRYDNKPDQAIAAARKALRCEYAANKQTLDKFAARGEDRWWWTNNGPVFDAYTDLVAYLSLNKRGKDGMQLDAERENGIAELTKSARARDMLVMPRK